MKSGETGLEDKHQDYIGWMRVSLMKEVFDGERLLQLTLKENYPNMFIAELII